MHILTLADLTDLTGCESEGRKQAHKHAFLVNIQGFITSGGRAPRGFYQSTEDPAFLNCHTLTHAAGASDAGPMH